ncbi:hypothetical protein [Mycolicibacterium palauense]|uniref:hypothetical protein n=1 Tax=Mycolicibacterium palauense TaxID=2034511 RepID=UPI001C3F2369|nr:hypothetical protein [Mycolicibacterium palauense]
MPSPGSTDARGYGPRHQRLREQLKPIVKSGQAICWRCGERIGPDQQWDLGHDDDNRNIYRGPEHALKRDCAAGGNRAAGGRKRQGVPDDDDSATYPPCDDSRVW